MSAKQISILSVKDILKNSRKINKKYSLNVFLTYLLWMLTAWIPYINIGTTIGLKAMVVKMSNNQPISPLDIFSGDHRKYMGEYLLLSFVLYSVLIYGYAFLVFPGIVMYLAWSQIFYLSIEKKFNFAESFKISYKLTFGEKWTIFFTKLSYLIPYLFTLLLSFVIFLIINSVQASNYKEVSDWDYENIYSLEEKIWDLEMEQDLLNWNDPKRDDIRREIDKLYDKMQENYSKESYYEPFLYAESWFIIISSTFGFIITIFLSVFNASVSSYIYMRFKEKI